MREGRERDEGDKKKRRDESIPCGLTAVDLISV